MLDVGGKICNPPQLNNRTFNPNYAQYKMIVRDT